jgi:hypothetical protein
MAIKNVPHNIFEQESHENVAVKTDTDKDWS